VDERRFVKRSHPLHATPELISSFEFGDEVQMPTLPFELSTVSASAVALLLITKSELEELQTPTNHFSALFFKILYPIYVDVAAFVLFTSKTVAAADPCTTNGAISAETT